MGRRVAETERKYDVPARSGHPDLTGLTASGPRAVPPVRLDAVYYDTPHLTLTSHRVTLRRRTGGEDEGWHLKLPHDLPDTRTEVRAPLTDDAVPPRELRAEIAALVRARPLTPVVRLRTTRRRILLLDADGAALAEVAFDDVRADPGPEWSEVEVELQGGGTPELLDAVEERLLAAGLHRSASGSKLARALGEARPPTAADRPPATPGTAGHTATAYLSAQLTAILTLDPAVRRAEGAEEDAVHKMRVATRRARSALRSFRRVLDRRATRPLAVELKWLASVLGTERDREVLTERLAVRLSELEPDLGQRQAEALRARLRDLPLPVPVPSAVGTAEEEPVEEEGVGKEPARQPSDAGGPPPGSGGSGRPGPHAAVVAELGGIRYFALLDAFEGLLAAPPYLRRAADPAEKAAVKTVERDHKRLRRAVKHALALPPGPGRDVALHEARKAAKRARYAAEAAEPDLGDRAAERTSRMKAVQQLLGEHQDSVMCRSVLARLQERAVAAGEDPEPYDAMVRAERRVAAEVEERLPDAWNRADRPLG